ncbi:MAG: delta-60 repeat domain-containing protein [Pyrinomonadaceae bacterium]
MVVGTTIVRYNGNGSLDTSFGNGGRVSPGFFAFAVVLQPDGKIVAAGGSVLARYNADGSLDSTFGNGGKVTVPGVVAFALVLQADGKLVTAGSVNGVKR